MKEVQVDILKHQEKDFFYPLRNKVDFARIVVYASRKLLIKDSSKGISENSKMKLLINKMKRLFFYNEEKCFSIAYPFTVYIEQDELIYINTLSGQVVDNKVLSEILAILNDVDSKKNFTEINFFSDYGEIKPYVALVLQEILLAEPSYIRYDTDKENENQRIHPLHHIDVNYSSNGTFKLGLETEISNSNFEDILNIKTNCSFLKY